MEPYGYAANQQSAGRLARDFDGPTLAPPPTPPSGELQNELDRADKMAANLFQLYGLLNERLMPVRSIKLAESRGAGIAGGAVEPMPHNVVRRLQRLNDALISLCATAETTLSELQL